jgi:tryptophanyl-tRNA synthetase
MIVFSGIRPTAHVHIGNYWGAIHQWLGLIHDHPKAQFFFCIVDQHALTTLEDAHNLNDNVLTMAATYIACGLDPKQHTLFVQSHVPYHTELAWMLGCRTPLGWLNRMTQFKDKAHQQGDSACLGLYAYPVLMAADILLYGTTHVPVGEDQKQHVELARDIAGSWNAHEGKEVFTLPEPLIHKETCRIMSLRDGTKKMSKSDPSDYSRIHLTDSDDEICQKIKKAKTDAGFLPESIDDLKDRPEAKNLLTLYAATQGKNLENVIPHFAGKSFAVVKKDLTEALIQHISPIRQGIANLKKEGKNVLKETLTQGAQRAHHHAQNMMMRGRGEEVGSS